MSNVADAGTPSQVIHLHLRAQFDLLVPVQIFCSSLLNSTGEQVYLLGLREDKHDNPAVQRQPDPDDLPAPGQPEATILGASSSIPEADMGYGCGLDIDAVRGHSNR